MSGLIRWLNAPANWCGLLVATGVLIHALTERLSRRAARAGLAPESTHRG